MRARTISVGLVLVTCIIGITCVWWLLRNNHTTRISSPTAIVRRASPSLYPTSEVPGALDDTVSQENIAETICVPGYTRRVRPKVSYTNAIKRAKLAEYSATASMKDYELDHFIPLALGGCAKCPSNLWIEPWPDARKKDVVEVYLHRRVCRGEITLHEAQRAIATDWFDVFLHIESTSNER